MERSAIWESASQPGIFTHSAVPVLSDVEGLHAVYVLLI
jgi:hypothetical protein